MEAKDYVLALIGAGCTQNEISDETGMPQATISKVKSGKVADVKSRNYRALQVMHDRVVGATATLPVAETDPSSAMGDIESTTTPEGQAANA